MSSVPVVNGLVECAKGAGSGSAIRSRADSWPYAGAVATRPRNNAVKVEVRRACFTAREEMSVFMQMLLCPLRFGRVGASRVDEEERVVDQRLVTGCAVILLRSVSYTHLRAHETRHD